MFICKRKCYFGGRLYEDGDVWVGQDAPPKHLFKKFEPDGPDEKVLSRDDIKEALDALEVDYKKNASTKKLAELLTSAQDLDI